MKVNILFLTLDDISILEFISYSLKEVLPDTTIKVLEASTDSEAMGILDSSRIDLIIADMNIDTIESYEFYDKLQLDNSYKNIPFIFLSSNIEDQEISLLKGISNFFLKPLNVTQLISALQKILKEMDISILLEEPKEEYQDEKSLLNTIYSSADKIEQNLEDNNLAEIKISTAHIKSQVSKLLKEEELLSFL